MRSSRIYSRIFLSFFVLLWFGQNCSSHYEFKLAEEESRFASKGGNGGIYEGKVLVFHHNEPGFTCEQQDRPKAILKREVDGNWNYTENIINKCNFIHVQAVEGVEFNPSAMTAVYKDAIFELPQVYKVIGGIGSYDTDLSDGVCADSTGQCSYLAAFSQARALVSDRLLTIELAAGTYSAPATIIDMNFPIRIVGAGISNTIIDGNNVQKLFSVYPPMKSVEFSELTMTRSRSEGVEDGGAIFGRADPASMSFLRLKTIRFSDNISGAGGGAVALSGFRLEMGDVDFRGNDCIDSVACRGSALYMKNGFVNATGVVAVANGGLRSLDSKSATFWLDSTGFQINLSVLSQNNDPITLYTLNDLVQLPWSGRRVLMNSQMYLNTGVALVVDNAGVTGTPSDVHILKTSLQDNGLGMAAPRSGRNIRTMNGLAGELQVVALQESSVDFNMTTSLGGTNLWKDPLATGPIEYRNFLSTIGNGGL